MRNLLNAKAYVERSTISNNVANSGGGVDNEGALFATNSTISGNHAKQDGGGVYNSAGGRSEFYNSTIAFNQADSDADFVGDGAGIWVHDGTIVTLRNTIIASNQLDYGNQDCFGALESYGNNRVSDAVYGDLSHCAITQKDLFGHHYPLTSQYELGALSNNGGPTQTIALVPPSDMIDGADPVYTAGCIDRDRHALATDQRNGARVGASCDIGAYEYGSTSDEIFADGFGVP